MAFLNSIFIGHQKWSLVAIKIIHIVCLLAILPMQTNTCWYMNMLKPVQLSKFFAGIHFTRLLYMRSMLTPTFDEDHLQLDSSQYAHLAQQKGRFHLLHYVANSMLQFASSYLNMADPEIVFIVIMYLCILLRIWFWVITGFSHSAKCTLRDALSFSSSVKINNIWNAKIRVIRTVCSSLNTLWYGEYVFHKSHTYV